MIGMNILIVDDEIMIRKVLKKMLINFNTYEAEDGLDAISVLKKEQIDIVISDVHMPNMKGIELHEHIEVFFPHVKFILMSGSPLHKSLNASKNFLKKPINPTDMIELVQSLV